MKRYQIIKFYEDGYSTTNLADDFILILGAVQIYIESQDCIKVIVFDFKTNRIVLQWERD